MSQEMHVELMDAEDAEVSFPAVAFDASLPPLSVLETASAEEAASSLPEVEGVEAEAVSSVADDEAFLSGTEAEVESADDAQIWKGDENGVSTWTRLALSAHSGGSSC